MKLIYTTIDNVDNARSLVKSLLDERLIACANIFPAGESLYMWEGEIKEEKEVYLFLKTTAQKLDELRERLTELHPYDVPCFACLGPEKMNDEYLSWIRKSVNN